MNNRRYRANIMLIGPQPGEQRALKYDPAMCDQVKMLAQDGMLPEEWAAHIGISMATIYRWANEYPEWEEAIIISWHLLAAFYARKARENLNNPDLKATVLMEILRKRFPSIWGKDPRGTQDHFEARDKGATGEKPLLNQDEMKGASDSVITDAIAKLEERRRILKGEG